MTTDAADPTDAGMAARRTRIPLPPIADTSAQIEGLVMSLENMNGRIDAWTQTIPSIWKRLEALEETPLPLPVPPVFTPPPYKPSVAAIVPLILSIVLILAQQTTIIVRGLPPSTPVTVALAVLTVLSASIPLIEQLLQQQQAHVERLSLIRVGKAS